jgi:hypothetical protein
MANELRIVGTFNYVDGKFVTVDSDSNKTRFRQHLPVYIPAEQISKYYPLKTGSVIRIGGLMNYLDIKAGLVLPFSKGKRIVLEAMPGQIVFIEVKTGDRRIPGIYTQTPYGFHSDWLSFINKKAADKTAMTVTLAEWEVQFLVGVVAGASWKGLTVVIGVDLFEESVTHKKTKATKDAVRVLQILYAFHKELKLIAPVLTSVIFDTMWLMGIKGQIQYLPSTMANDPKVAARASGTIVAQLGKKSLEQRLTVTSILWTIISQLAIKGALTIPAAAGKTVNQLTSKEPQDIVNNLEQTLKSVDVVMSTQEKIAILNEIAENPVEIGKIFQRMVADLRNPPK